MKRDSQLESIWRSKGLTASWRVSYTPAELHLTLRQTTQTHQQTLSVHDKKVRITIPARVADG